MPQAAVGPVEGLKPDVGAQGPPEPPNSAQDGALDSLAPPSGAHPGPLDLNPRDLFRVPAPEAPDAPDTADVMPAHPRVWERLSTRLTLGLTAFLMVLFLATSANVYKGFLAARITATDGAAASLEAQAAVNLQSAARREARLEQALINDVATVTRLAAKALNALSASTPPPLLAKTAGGVSFDANPERLSDVFVPRGADSPATRRAVGAAQSLEPLFGALLAQNPDVVAIYYVHPSGAVRYAPVVELQAILPPEYNPNRRRLYTQAAPANNPSGSTVWVGPYLDEAGQGWLVTASTPAFVHGKFRGVIAADVSLERLAAHLEGALPATPFASTGGASLGAKTGQPLPAAPDVFALVLARDGTVTAATPSTLRSLSPRMLRYNDLTPEAGNLNLKGASGFAPLMRALQAGRSTAAARPRTGATSPGPRGAATSLSPRSGGTDPSAGASGSARVTVNGRAYLAAFSPLEGIAWDLVLASSVDVMTRPAVGLAAQLRETANRTLGLTLAIALAMFILALAATAVFTRSRVTDPIEALVAGTHAIARGNLKVRVIGRGRSELAMLAGAFNAMAKQLQERRAALERSETRFNLAMRGARDGIFDWDIVTNRVYFSPRWKEMLGFRDDELPNNFSSWASRLHPEDRDQVIGQTQRHLSGHEELLETEHRLRAKNGEYLWVLARGAVQRDAEGRPLRYSGSQTDITDRVRVMQELEHRVAERTLELTALLAATRDVALTLELGPLLTLLLERVEQVLPYTAASVMVLDAPGRLRMLRYRGPLTLDESAPDWDLNLARHLAEVVETRAAVVIPDVRADDPLAWAYQASAVSHFGAAPERGGAFMAVPLTVRDAVIGVLAFDHAEPGFFSRARADLAQAFAHQAAVAVDNARLFEAARGKAALEERQKLARELHDSVSQALYGIALGARTAKSVLSEPARAAPAVDYVLNLAEAGLAEMRALIFELRPESLEREGLTAALGKQAAAIHARYGLHVSLEVGDEPAAPIEVKQALLRIAQEALNNAVKHAHAKNITISLGQDAASGELVLCVRDDGVGFDVTRDYPGHLGQRSMRERAEALGARLVVTSAPGEGACVSVRYPRPAGSRPTLEDS